jgi:hypothetical protein
MKKYTFLCPKPTRGASPGLTGSCTKYSLWQNRHFDIYFWDWLWLLYDPIDFEVTRSKVKATGALIINACPPNKDSLYPQSSYFVLGYAIISRWLILRSPCQRLGSQVPWLKNACPPNNLKIKWPTVLIFDTRLVKAIIWPLLILRLLGQKSRSQGHWLTKLFSLIT